MSDFDDEQDVPFADHSTGRDRTGDRVGERRGHDHDERIDDDAAEDDGRRVDDSWGARPGDGAGNPLGDFAGEARRAFGLLRGFVAPLLESYPEVREHLGAAGAEVANAYRAVIRNREQTWREGSDGPDGAERITVEQIDADEQRRAHDEPGSGGHDEPSAGGSDHRNTTD